MRVGISLNFGLVQKKGSPPAALLPSDYYFPVGVQKGVSGPHVDQHGDFDAGVTLSAPPEFFVVFLDVLLCLRVPQDDGVGSPREWAKSQT